MKLALHARSLLDSSDGYHRNLLDYILQLDSDWVCVFPSDLNESEQRRIESRLAESQAGKNWPRLKEEDLTNDVALICLTFPGINDSICSSPSRNASLFVAYNPANDDECASNLSALIRWETEGILTAATVEDLPRCASAAQEMFFCQRHLPFSPSIELAISPNAPLKERDTLFIVKRESTTKSTRSADFPDGWPQQGTFNSCLDHWIPVFGTFDIHQYEADQGYDQATVESIAKSHLVVVASNDPSFCQTIAKVASTYKTRWLVLAGPRVYPLGFLLAGLPANLGPIPPIQKTTLRTLFKPIQEAMQNEVCGIESERFEKTVATSQPVNQIELLRANVAKRPNPQDDLFWIDDPLYPKTDLPPSNSDLNQTWQPVWKELASKGLTIPGLRRSPPIHSANLSQAQDQWLEHFAQGILFADELTSEVWTDHFAACVRLYPNFIDCCETVLQRLGKTGLRSFLLGGDTWASLLAHRIFAVHQKDLFAKESSKNLQKAAVAACKLLRHDLRHGRTIDRYFFSLIFWDIVSGNPDRALQTVEATRNSDPELLIAELSQIIAFLSTTRYKRYAPHLLAQLSDDIIDTIKGDDQLLYISVACALNDRSKLAQRSIDRLFESNPDILVTPESILGFNPDLYFASLYQATGEKDLATKLFERTCSQRPFLANHAEYFLGEIPEVSNLRMPVFNKPSET